ncbi:MAG: sensor histidine kinase, partial [Rubricella sp.]
MESPQVEPDTAQDLAVERERLSWTILEFASLTLAMAGSLAALFMIFIVGDAAETVWITPVLLPIAAFLSVPVAMRMGLPLRVGQILFFGIALATITGFAFVERSATLSGYLLFLPILITISGMILDRRGIIAVTAASLAIGVLSLWWDLRQQPILLDLSEPAPIFTFGIRNLVAIGFAALITLIALNIFSTLVARLRDARDRASETARARTEFLSSLSHEVRTPLNAIIGLSEILSREELEDDNLRKIDTISGAGRALLAVLDDVLDAARIEAGQMRINPVVTDIESLVFSVADLWGPVAEEKGLSFRVELDEAVPETLVLDRSRVRQCLNNLLSNAIKFTDAGQVSLGITWRGEAGRDAVLECAVRDSGSGMSPA